MATTPDEFYRPHLHSVAALDGGTVTHDHSPEPGTALAGHPHREVGFGPARMTEDNRRRRASEAGKKGKGPRPRTEKGDRVTKDGFKVPKGFTGTRNARRNQAIHDLHATGVWTAAGLAEAFSVSVETIRHVLRYFEPTGKEA